ncbi:MAG: flagellar biosynthetic protein FliO [Proteobacteria bacterium]|nr:flagellar biosynthetic protein FliO [Pseudomonadota bacterium]
MVINVGLVLGSLVFVLGLLGLFLWSMRYWTTKNPWLRSEKRLKIIEMISLDPKRKLILVNRDNTDHLLLLSPSGDLIIEKNIRLHNVQSHVA